MQWRLKKPAALNRKTPRTKARGGCGRGRRATQAVGHDRSARMKSGDANLTDHGQLDTIVIDGAALLLGFERGDASLQLCQLLTDEFGEGLAGPLDDDAAMLGERAGNARVGPCFPIAGEASSSG
jgi:hypothetical protein